MKKTLLIALGAVASSTVLAAYPNLGVETTFNRIGLIGTANAWSGSGTIISPNHVLTAKHVGGTWFHSRNNGQTNSGSFQSVGRINHTVADLAILEFAPNTFNTWWRPVYANQLGTVPTMAGFGLTANLRANGTGYNSAGGSGIRRRTVNTADVRFSVNLGAGITNSISLLYDLDGAPGAPGDRNTYGSGNPVAGEGGILSGDSGGAWLVPNGSSWNIIAVNSFIFDAGGAGGPINNFLDWGDGGGAVDLFQYENWIETNAPVPEPASMIALGLGVAALAARRRRRK